MLKTYCDICGKEIKISGLYDNGTIGNIVFKMEAGYKELGKGDICLPCVIKAVNKEASKVLKRKYTKKQKEEASGTADSNPSDS